MKQRLITGLIAGAAFLCLLVLGSYWFTAVIAVLALIGFHEFVKMNGVRSGELSALFGFAGILYLVVPFEQMGVSFAPPRDAFIWFSMFVFLSITVASRNRVTIDRAALLFIGMVYIGIGFHYMIVTRDLGLFWTALVYICIWASDSGAYFSGLWFGKTKLWPSISPKKTVEGAIGGIITSAAVAILFSLHSPHLLTLLDAVIIGAVIAIVGQLGDLIESAYKRARDIKDTGTILPGHGGVLDRCDSWLIVFPFVHFFSLLQ